MSVKKVTVFLHRWLGLTSGLVVFIVSVTGCLYAFQVEIQNLLQPYRFIEAQTGPMLPPSQLRDIAVQQLPDKHIHAIQYHGTTEAAQAIFYHYEPTYYYIVYLNPYSGRVLKVKDMSTDFFYQVLQGHYYLWLPPLVGQTIVVVSMLVFVVLMISGIILWWPRKNGVRQRFTIQWNARWRRKNFDLHAVMGFYITWLALLFTLTGLVWGFPWFTQGLYWTMSGGETLNLYQEPPSDTTRIHLASPEPSDKVWLTMRDLHPDAASLEIHFPESKSGCIAANANPAADTYWKTDYRYFDQYTLAEIPTNQIYGRFDLSSNADKVLRLNYDIHTGGIFGLPGKLLAFFGSLICASLPVTGFLLWWGRRKKSKDHAPVSRHEATVKRPVKMRKPVIKQL